jgi:hypothetical protein
MGLGKSQIGILICHIPNPERDVPNRDLADYIGDIKNGHGNLNFLNGFFSLFFSCLMLGKVH